MINWFDLMRQAQGGAGIENLARQFGLTPQQTNAAIAALMPAFAMGLQRAAMNPTAMANLFQIMAGSHFPAFWESATQAFTPQARDQGKHLLDQLFGSDEVSRRVAHQAAAFSGVGVDVLQQMLPLLAGIVAGGLTKMATGQGALWAGLAAAPQAAPPPPGQTGSQTGGPAGFGAWADLWSQWMGVARPPEPQPRQSQTPINPFEAMMMSFLRAAAPPETSPKPESKAQPKPESKPESKSEPEKPAAAAGPLEAWGEMMDKGHEMQRQYLESLQSIFDSVWGRSSP